MPQLCGVVLLPCRSSTQRDKTRASYFPYKLLWMWFIMLQKQITMYLTCVQHLCKRSVNDLMIYLLLLFFLGRRSKVDRCQRSGRASRSQPLNLSALTWHRPWMYRSITASWLRACRYGAVLRKKAPRKHVTTRKHFRTKQRRTLVFRLIVAPYLPHSEIHLHDESTKTSFCSWLGRFYGW